MNLEQLLQYIFSGITMGGIYAVVAIGYNIIYSATGIINFSQGEFVMIGGMLSYTFAEMMPLVPAIALSVAITVLIGALIEIIFIRTMKRPSVLGMIIITIGLSIIIREVALHVWDEQIRALKFFSGTEISSISIFGAHVSPQVPWVLGTTAMIVLGLYLFFTYTLTGQAMRACSANPTAAKLCGIKTTNLVTLSFMLSAGIGALAGSVVSPLTQTHYAMGTPLAVKGFTVAILGGLGNSMAAVVAGLLLGLIEAFSVSVVPMAYTDAIAIGILLIILFVKPSGLFGSAEAAALKEY